MKISVIITAYNVAPFIERAIDSVLTQTRKADEIIVVDDKSTDQTRALVANYGDLVKLIAKPDNSGALQTSLLGVESASFDICCMLDGDDEWAPNKLEEVERYFEQNPNAILLSHHHVRVDETGKELNVSDSTHENIERILSANAGNPKGISDALKDSILAQKGYWMGSAYSFRRTYFDAEKFRRQIHDFQPMKYVYFDMMLGIFLMLTNREKDAGYTDRTHFLYRIHAGGSLSGNKTVEKALHSIMKGRAISKLQLLLCEKNGADEIYLETRRESMMEYEFLECLYTKKHLEAFKVLVRLGKNQWQRKKLLKEAIRFSAVVALGPERFLRVK